MPEVKEHPMLFSGPMVEAILKPCKSQTRRLITPENVRFFDGMGRSWKPSAEQLAASLTEASDFRNLGGDTWTWKCKSVWHQNERVSVMAHCKWKIGDRLWVRESYGILNQYGNLTGMPLFEYLNFDGDGLSSKDCRLVYRADGREYPKEPSKNKKYQGKWRPNIHLPRWASRITLEITEVRPERLHEISEADAVAEGIEKLKSGRGYYDPTMGHAAVHAGHYFASAAEAYMVLWESINGAGSSDANPLVWVLGFRRVENA